MSDAYDFRPGGSLKLKGGANDGGGKKKKKKSKAKEDKSDIELAAKKEQIKERLKTNHNSLEQSNDSGSDRNSPALQGSSSKKTEAERRFEEVQRERLQKRVAKLAGKTHKDRVSEFNAHLESLSEHHDIPKVGPG